MKTFKELNLIKPIERALAAENYETPTPIQAKTIPAALEGRDVLGCAQTGTGKTAAFAIPILQILGNQKKAARKNQPLALLLAPTRELAIQIGQSFAVYGKHLKLRHCVIYGGVKQGSQVRALNQGAHILIATPGRLLDLMNQGYIKLDKLEQFVLDEADRMLDMGFLPDLKRIIKQLPKKRQSLFFSATIAPEVVELTKTLLKNPISVNVTPKSRSVKSIEQSVIFVSKKGKQALLTDLLYEDDVEQAIVFTKTKRTANVVARRLCAAGIKAEAIHGNKSQNARQRALDAFRKGFARVLVATDVAARGIDIEGVTHVFNYDIPHEPEAYVHRIGRTGRAGAVGIAISFCSSGDQSDLRAIEKLIEQKIPVDEELSVNVPRDSGNSRRSGGRSSRTGSSRGASSRRSSSQPKSRKSSSDSSKRRSSKSRSDDSAESRSFSEESTSKKRTGGSKNRTSRSSAQGSTSRRTSEGKKSTREKSTREKTSRGKSTQGKATRSNSSSSSSKQSSSPSRSSKSSVPRAPRYGDAIEGESYGSASRETKSDGKRSSKRRRRRDRTSKAADIKASRNGAGQGGSDSDSPKRKSTNVTSASRKRKPKPGNRKSKSGNSRRSSGAKSSANGNSQSKRGTRGSGRAN